jgi:SAM-dependent methyltransferase
MMQSQTNNNQNELERKAAGQLAEFLRDCGINELQGKRLLEIGFKNGLFLDECRKARLDAIGLEINPVYVSNVQAAFPSLDVRLYDGGRFPFNDASFDFIVSFQVFEHVDSVSQIIEESLRLLKPGGMMYHICPNYRSFYEGHFNVVWLPFLNKPLGRLYLKLLGRYKPGFENLNIIKPKEIMAVLNKHKNELELISLGKKEFVRKFNHEQIAKVNNRFLRRALELLLKAGQIKNGVLACICAAGVYYPLTLICRKV